MAVSPSGSLFVSDNGSEKLLTLKLKNNEVIVLSTKNIKPYGLTMSPSDLGSPLIVMKKKTSTLGIKIEMTAQTIDYKYYIHPWIIRNVHVTRDQKVIIGSGMVLYDMESFL